MTNQLQLHELNVGDEIVATDTVPDCLKTGQTYTVKQGDGFLYVDCEAGEQHPLASHRVPKHFKRFIQKKGGWIGVDLDSTLCVYEKWEGPYVLGAPIPRMVERVKAWLAEGRDVRIFTARMTDLPFNRDGTAHDLGVERASIEAWCQEHIGQVLPITNVKDWDMVELWDDRAIQVRPNTGVSLAEELEATKNAEAEPKYPAE